MVPQEGIEPPTHALLMPYTCFHWRFSGAFMGHFVSKLTILSVFSSPQPRFDYLLRACNVVDIAHRGPSSIGASFPICSAPAARRRYSGWKRA